MIAMWMLSSLAFSLLVAAAALSAEKVLRATGRQARWAWIAGMMIATSWPVVAPLARHPAPGAAAPAVSSGAASPSAAIEPVAMASPLAWMQRLDIPLIALWALASALVLGRLVLALMAMQRMRAAGRRERIDGVDVIVSEDTGPALVGVVQPAVMIPASLLDLDASLRRLVLRHEDEHRRSHDPLVILAAAIAVALFPWNLAMWWMAQRARLSLEVDCDARVLAGEASPAVYGKLLLLISQRPAAATLAPMLAAHDSHLEQRITAMLPVRTSARIRTAFFGAAATVILAAAACTTRIADVSAPAPIDAAKSPDGGVAYFEFQVDQQARTTGMSSLKYPDLLRSSNVSGEVLAQFIVDENGRYLDGSFKVLRSSHALFTEAVRTALPTIVFKPAELKGKRVRQLVQQPFTFALSAVADAKPVQGVQAKKPATAGASNSVSRASTDSAPKPYFEFKLNKQAEQIPGTGNLRYPDELRRANVEGEVLAQFVVLDDGTVMPGSLKVLKSSHELFTQAVRDNLSAMRFTPAQADGHNVRQMMQMPFTFSLSKE